MVITEKTSPELENTVLTSRRKLKAGPLRIAKKPGLHPRTVSRILAGHQVPRLSSCHRLTGQQIRASRATNNRYERERPGNFCTLT